MMRYVAFLLVALGALSSLAPAGAAQIRLNEILADPATDWNGDGEISSKLDEWVEIMNIGSSEVDLSSYRLSDESSGTEWRYVLSGTLAPGEVLVIFGSRVVEWQSANGVPAFGLSLNNSGDTVTLYEESGGQAIVSDAHTYKSTEIADDRAVGRLPVGTGEWVVFDGLNPYSGSAFPSTGCPPSPGQTIQCATPIETSSWGSVKSMYGKLR
ncbi:MAG: lamin tail domain-containing protein [Candidatus Krumholzibacteriota bacterium]|nr:lamin tail domain-containing protein [Candidatus Krumholzibacteriota bacterium]